jgi:hypothetical protein
VQEAKRLGKYNESGVVVPAGDIKFKSRKIIYQCPESGTETWHNEYLIDRGTTFDVASARLAEEVRRRTSSPAASLQTLYNLMLRLIIACIQGAPAVASETPAGCLLLQKEADEDTYSGFYSVTGDNGHILPIMVCWLSARSAITLGLPCSLLADSATATSIATCVSYCRLGETRSVFLLPSGSGSYTLPK